MEKTKVLNNYKSAKNLPSPCSIETAFKKGHKRLEAQVEPKDKRDKHSANKQYNANLKPTNIFNKVVKSPNNESNKISNSKSSKVGHNPEQFLTRNQ